MEISYSTRVKEELYKHIDGARHCQLAELTAIINSCGHFEMEETAVNPLIIRFDKKALFRKCFTLLKKTYNINFVSNEGYAAESEDGDISEIVITDEQTIDTVLRGIKAIDKKGSFTGLGGRVDSTIIRSTCCKQAYIRGMFLCKGFVNEPAKGYHLEMTCETNESAEQLVEVLALFDIDAKIVCRKKRFVVYIKEGNALVQFLGICGARVSVMNLESFRVLKSVGNDVNRRNNCDVANIKKTAEAYNRLVEDINLIRNVYGFEKLPDNLREMAEIRLEYPEASLQKLGELLDPPVGKSGVNHRLRKLSELADTLR